MKKSLLALTIAISALLTMASCDSGDTGSKADDTSKNTSTESAVVSDASADETSEDESADDSKVNFETKCEDALEETDLYFYSTNNGVDADAYWFFKYGETSAKVQAYVNDHALMIDGDKKDGIVFYVGEVKDEAKFDDGKAVKVEVYVDGTTVAKAYENGDFSKDVEVSIALEGWKVDDFRGYCVAVEIPYEIFGLDAETAYSSLGIAPALVNYNGADPEVSFTDKFGCKGGFANGLIKVIDDDTYEANPFSGIVNLGAADAYIPLTGNWDLTADYAEDDPNYADRKAVLSSDGTNTAYFTNINGPILYAEGTFKISAIKNNDAWPKFGFLFNDGTNNGLFCFIDAGTGDSTKTELTDICKDDAGYVHIIDGEYSWSSTEKIDWPTGWKYDQAITLAVFRNGDTVTFFVNGAPTYVITDVSAIKDDNLVSVGLSAFNVDMEVTNYRCTDDVDDAKIQELLKK